MAVRALRTFFSVVLPLSGPAIASAAIFQAVFIWNEFILALLMLTSPENKTLPVGIITCAANTPPTGPP